MYHLGDNCSVFLFQRVFRSRELSGCAAAGPLLPSMCDGENQQFST
jgi:hypothetical protein